MDNTKPIIYIFSARVAKDLIKNGFQLVNISPNKKDPKRTVFLFLYTPALKEYLKNTHNIAL